MTKLNKLSRSQNAHKRLFKKHKNSKSDYDSFVKSSYHSQVISTQSLRQEVLSKAEKKAIYRSCEYYYFN